MQIRNLVKFRQWVKDEYGLKDDALDPNYMGIQTEYRSQKKYGLYYLFHGINRSGLRNALFGSLQLAEDTQGIYEFIQNSADCESSYFAIYFDDDYFLAFNNGKKFTNSNVVAILNEGDSDKTDGSSIGRFGVGFKIVHRLVGETDGLNELVDRDKPKGPVIFSWDKQEDIENFFALSNEKILEEDPNEDVETANHPWLFKILLTNFPTAPTHQEIQKVKGLDDFETKERQGGFYTLAELQRFRKFLKQFQEDLYDKNGRDLLKENRGSLFFIELGEGKRKKIEDDIEKLQDGFQFSLNFLGYDKQQNNTQSVRKLETINLNNQEFSTYALEKEDVFIETTNDIFKQLIHGESKTPVKITFAYQDFIKKENLEKFDLRKRPNFFKFFPMDKETVGLNFVIHSDAFIIEKSRRELQQNDQRNIILFTYLIKTLINRLNEYQEIPFRFDDFLNIFASILTSKKPRESHLWIKTNLYDPLFDYLKSNIPTEHFRNEELPISRRIKRSLREVKSKNTSLEISPFDLGIPNIEWFFWKRGNDDNIEEEASDILKLNIKRWNIIDILVEGLKEGQLNRINQWIKGLDDNNYNTLIQEIDEYSSEYQSILDIKNIQLFKCNYGKQFCSVEDFLDSQKRVVLCFNLIQPIQPVLTDLGLTLSDNNISEFQNLYKFLKEEIKYLGDLQTVLYDDYIKPSFPNDNLNSSQRIKLFKLLKRFKGINLKDLPIFCNTLNIYKPLKKLLQNSTSIPKWLVDFKIHNDFTVVSNQFKDDLLPNEDIFKEIIYKYWDKIIRNLDKTIITSFYSDVYKLYNSERDRGYELFNKDVFIFTNDGFKRRQEVFFNSKLENVKSVVGKITLKKFPKNELTTYFNDKASPFYISEDKLIENINVDKLELQFEEANSLIDFAIKAEESLFEYSYLDEKFIFHKNKDQKQYFLSGYEEDFRKKFDGYIEKYLMDYFKPLESKLYFSNSKGISVLRLRKELGLTIVDERLNFSSLNAFKDFLPIVQNLAKDTQNKYLQKIERLDLNVNTTYSKAGFEYQSIKLFAKNYTAKRFIDDFKSKIFINGIQLGGEKPIKYKQEILLDTPKQNKIKLPYSKLLPNDADNNSQLIDQITQQFKGEGFEKIFVKETEDVSTIYKKLLKDYKRLKNLFQLAFILYYAPSELKSSQYAHFDKKTIIDFFYSNSFEVTVELINIIGLKQSNSIKIFPNHYALSSEQLQRDLQLWINNEPKKENFIGQLGVSTQDSSIVKLRQFFIGNNTLHEGKKAEAELSNQPQILKNTISWLFEQKLLLDETTNKARLDILKNIYNNLSLYDRNLPLPFIVKMNNNQRVYTLKSKTFNQLYWYPNNNEHKVHFAKIFNVIQQKKFQCLDKTYFNNVWINSLQGKDIQLVTEVDKQALKTINTSLNEEYYQEWKKDYRHINIFKIPYIPHKETFFQQKIYSTPSSEVKREYFPIGHNYYISQQYNLFSVLKKYLPSIHNQLREYENYIKLKRKLDKPQLSGQTVNLSNKTLLQRLLVHAQNETYNGNDTRLAIIRDIHSKLTNNLSYPLILIKDITLNGTITYEVSNKKGSLFKGINTFPIAQKRAIFQIIVKKDHSLLADNYLPKVVSQSIELTEKIVTDGAKAWDAEHYNNWKYRHQFQIYLINGLIPYVKQFLGEDVSNVGKKGNIEQDKWTKRIYVNQNSNIEKELERIIDFDPYIRELNKLKKTDNTVSPEIAKLLNEYGITSVYELEPLLKGLKNKSKDNKNTSKKTKNKANILSSLVSLLGFKKITNPKGYHAEKQGKDNKKKLVNTEIFNQQVDYSKDLSVRLTPDVWTQINTLDDNSDFYFAIKNIKGEIEYLKISKEKSI